MTTAKNEDVIGENENWCEWNESLVGEMNLLWRDFSWWGRDE